MAFDFLRGVLTDLKENGLAQTLTEMLPTVVSHIEEELNTWEREKIHHVIADPIWEPITNFMVLDYYAGDNELVYHPYNIRRLEDGFIICNYHTNAVKLNPDLSYNSVVLPRTLTGGMRDITFAGEYVVGGCATYLKGFKDGEEIWSKPLGNYYDNKIGYVNGVDTLPNGNVIVSCSNYRGVSGDNSNGFVAEVDPATGDYVRLILSSDTNKEYANVGGCKVPQGLRVDGNDIYVINYYGDLVEVLTFDPETEDITYTRSLRRPSGGTEMRINSVDIKGDLAAVSLDSHQVGIVNKNTGEIIWYDGTYGNEAGATIEKRPGVFNMPTGVAFLEDGSLLVASYNNNNLKRIDTRFWQVINYEGVGENDEIVYSSVPIENGITKIRIFETPITAEIFLKKPLAV